MTQAPQSPASLPAAPPAQPPSTDEINEALDVLDRLGWYLRDPGRVAEFQPLLARVLDEEYGVPMVLGAILRNAAHLIEDKALAPWPVEVRRIIAQLRAAAPEVTDCHDLHWAVHQLAGMPFHSLDPVEFRSAVTS
ncbi:hypothetical protein ACFC0M_06170 [Streptomyces sp. NPDC056149]|uniref:hypothetical protein n=1 Tax=Streptomyces sp. NPDC056149 TaxID=3345728 RepID=UPI0035DB6240